MNKELLLEQVIEIAKEAGTKIKNERNFEVHEKGDAANIVTDMDIQIQKMVLSKLETLLPNASFYAEEEGQRDMNDGFVWVVDPIDGTTNYAYDLHTSCISIGLLYQKQGYLGVVYNPYLDECFYARKGCGAYLNGNPIHVSENDIAHSLFSVGTTPYDKDHAQETFDKLKRLFLVGKDIRRSGSAAIDLCNLAAGRYDGFYECALAPWDYAASETIIKEAGGIIDTMAPYTWGYEGSITIVAGNKNNIEDLKEILK